MTIPSRAATIRAGNLTRSTARNTARLTVAWALLLCLGAGLPAKAPEFLLPIGPDQGTYTYVAERILEGRVPYRDAWDNKPPGTYYAHALVLSLVPANARWGTRCLWEIPQPCGYLALQAADVLWTAATAAALFAVARQMTGRSSVGWLAAGVFVTYANLSQLSREGSTPEKQLLLPMVLSYLAVLRWYTTGRLAWLVAGGLLTGLAFLFKQTAVSIPIALLIWGGWHQNRQTPGALWATLRSAWRQGAAYLGGLVAPIVLTSLYLASQGALGAFWDAAFAYNVTQADGPIETLVGFVIGAWQVASRSSALLWLLALGGALSVMSSVRAGSRTRLAVAWAVADLGALFLGGAKFAQVYFVQLVPSFAILAAIALAQVWTVTAPLSRWWRGYMVVALASLFLVTNPFQIQVMLRAWNDRVPPRAFLPPEHLLAVHLPQFLDPSVHGPALVWGDASQVYVLAGVEAPGRFFHTFPLSRVFAKGEGFLENRAELIRAMDEDPPIVIVVDPATSSDDPNGSLDLNLRTFPELESRLASEYEESRRVAVGGGWKVYERRLTDLMIRRGLRDRGFAVGEVGISEPQTGQAAPAERPDTYLLKATWIDSETGGNASLEVFGDQALVKQRSAQLQGSGQQVVLDLARKSLLTLPAATPAARVSSYATWLSHL